MCSGPKSRASRMTETPTPPGPCRPHEISKRCSAPSPTYDRRADWMTIESAGFPESVNDYLRRNARLLSCTWIDGETSAPGPCVAARPPVHARRARLDTTNRRSVRRAENGQTARGVPPVSGHPTRKPRAGGPGATVGKARTWRRGGTVRRSRRLVGCATRFLVASPLPRTHRECSRWSAPSVTTPARVLATPPGRPGPAK